MKKQEETRQVDLAVSKAEFQAVQAQHETVCNFPLICSIFCSMLCNCYRSSFHNTQSD